MCGVTAYILYVKPQNSAFVHFEISRHHQKQASENIRKKGMLSRTECEKMNN